MKHFEMKRRVFGLGLILTVSSLLGHGVGRETLVRTFSPHRGQQIPTETWMSIDQLQVCASEYAVHVKTWQERQRAHRLKPVQATSTGQINCYMQLWFVSNPYQVLRCAPDQLFYVLPQPESLHNVISASGNANYVKYADDASAISHGYWAQACTIAAGQILLRENFDGQAAGIQVMQVDFRAQPLTVYNLDVQDDHTYLVTGYNVVTHNSQLGADLVHANFTKGCEVAAATGVLATVGAWLTGLGFTSSSGGLCTIGFSSAVSAPVLIAAGTIGVGYMAWQILNWLGGKHVQVSQELDTRQVHKVWAGFNQPTLPCGAGTAQSIPVCGVELRETFPIQAKAGAIQTSCGTTFVKGAEVDPLVICGGAVASGQESIVSCNFAVEIEADNPGLLDQVPSEVLFTTIQKEVVYDTNKNEAPLEINEVNNGIVAVLKDGYYEVNGFRFSKYYYEKLWVTGRGAPSLVVQEILKDAEDALPDSKPGFIRYEANGWELILNPLTKEVWHISKITNK